MKFTLFYTIKNPNPEANDLQMVAGETEADHVREAAKVLDPLLHARIGHKNEGKLVEAIIRDESGKDRSVLQIDTSANPVTKVQTRTPRWGTWLTIHYSEK